MNKEEREAIEYLSMYAGDEENRVYEGECTYNIELLLNYINKLQQENKELKEKLHEKNMQIIKLNELLGGKDG